MSESIVIVGAARTPMGGFQGDFSSLAAHDLGGAAIKGEIVLADGATRPVDYSYFTPSINDVWGYSVWRDADRAFERFGDQIERGRF